VHAHDWLTARAAATVTEEIGVPWVHTIHATEAGRHQGWLPNGLSRTIHSVEQWSVDHADRILVCSRHMKWEVERLFGMSDVAVIPNGIDSPPPLVDTTAAASIVTQQGRPLIVHTGRLEWEKGAHTVIEAMPFIRRAFPEAHLVVAGRGSQQEALKELAHDKDVASRVDFTGWLPDAQLRAVVRDADVAVVPSIYEPFGIVALEAAVLGTPVVTSRAGGLAEFVDNDRHGWSFDAGNARELADAVISCVNDAAESRARADRAQSHVLAEHGWASITERIVDEYRATQAKVNTRGGGARKAVGAWADDVEINGNLLFDVQ
jgi:glycogen(starch) synthase